MSRLIAYRVPPQMEFKAARELREHGHRAYVPRDLADKRKPPVARGYVFSGGKHAFARHVRGAVGAVTTAELGRLYPKRDRARELPLAFEIGDKVLIQRGAFAALPGTVVGHRAPDAWLVDVSLFGKTSRVSMATRSMRKHDPGG